MTDKQKDFLEKVITALKNAKQGYNVGYVILPLREAFEHDSEFLSCILDRPNFVSIVFSYERDITKYVELVIGTANNESSVQGEWFGDDFSHSYSLRFFSSTVYEFDGEEYKIPMLKVVKNVHIDSYKTIKCESEIDEFVENFDRTDKEILKAKKTEEIKELEEHIENLNVKLKELKEWGVW